MPFFPGTNNPVTHSYEDRLMTAEFDDALLSQAHWKNARFDGCKLTATKINEYNAGDVAFQNAPTLMNQTTALYLSNTIIGGTEDPQFATLQGHSYLGINKILLINPIDDSVQVLDKTSEPFSEFHRFITNDLPTGAKCKVKVIDESISDNLQGRHYVKMNKGYLLKSLSYIHGGDVSGSTTEIATNYGSNQGYFLLENNSMYLYKSGTIKEDNYSGGQINSDAKFTASNNALRFRYGMMEIHAAGSAEGSVFGSHLFGPSYASSSILENKFTKQFYSGSWGHIYHQPFGVSTAEQMKGNSLGSASKFMGIDALAFLASNSLDTSLTQQEKTEIHVTFFEGTKDFAPGTNDERSIGTFEVDTNIAGLGLRLADTCSGQLPTNHELTFKGTNDGRFMPTINTFEDYFISAHMEQYDTGCVQAAQAWSLGALSLGWGMTYDKYEKIQCYIQGGALGEIGYNTVQSGNIGGTYGQSLLEDMTSDNFYSGSFRYDFSFLDKDHTVILNLNKEAELFDGTGNKGVVIIPEHTITKIRFNIEYYLFKAGIIDSIPNVTTNISPGALSED